MSDLAKQNALFRYVASLKQGTAGEEINKNALLRDGKVKMTETRIYVGLNDSVTKKQLLETEEYLATLKEVCRKYHAAFSVDIEQGGYFHEDGQYTEETSFVLVLIDTKEEVVQGIARDLCDLFHQESVLVTNDAIVGEFICAKKQGEE